MDLFQSWPEDNNLSIMKQTNSPVFIGLSKPFKAKHNGTVSSILAQSIKDAGLAGQGYTSRCFRLLGVTAAIQAQCEPNSVRQIGRWRSADVFFYLSLLRHF